MIRIADDGPLRRITLDRADKANALTPAMLADLIAALRGAPGHVLVLTGAGKVFSAGADLEAVRTEGLATSPLWEELSGAIAAFPGLAIAALNGTCAGGALGMVLACDLRVAVPGAALFYPVMKMGVLPQPSDPARLAALAGPARAARMLLAAERVDAATALDWGLIDQVADDPLAAAQALAAPALAANPAHVAKIKALIP